MTWICLPRDAASDPRFSPLAECGGFGRHVVVFRAAGFPTVDAPPIASATMDQALRGVPVEILDDLRKLQPAADAVLVLPYGSAFPLEAWPQLRDWPSRGAVRTTTAAVIWLGLIVLRLALGPWLPRISG